MRLVGFYVFGLVGALSEIFLTNVTLFQEFRAARVGLRNERSCTIDVTAFFLSAAGTAIFVATSTVQVLGECKTPKDAKIAPCRPPAARKSFTLLRRVSVISRSRLIQLLKLPDHPLEGHDVLGRGAQRGSLGRRHYSGVHYSGCLSSVHADSRRGCTIVIYSLQFLCCCGYFAPSRETAAWFCWTI